MARKLLPMGVSNVPALIDRTYRESHPFQWVREALINSKEAGAKRVHFGVEWQGVENKGVYRRIILDDGSGMTASEMLLFLNTYGGSGKPIGGEHENFGHGFKTSTLPWNRNGIVVVSKSLENNGAMAMVRLEFDQKQNEYGARLEDVGGVRDAVYAPYDATDIDGIDYKLVIPEDWESGVAIVLLGSPQQPDTVLGAYDRDEADLNGIARYLNTRIWEFVETKITVDYFNTSKRSAWPKTQNDKEQPNTTTKKWQARRVYGAKYHIEFEQKQSSDIVGRVEHHGIVEVADGLAKVHWFLRSGQPTQSSSVANYRGYIGHLYSNEVYTVLNHPSSFRSFGIPGWLKENVFLIVEPKVFDRSSGAYPNDARTQLLLGGKDAGRALPIIEWSQEFANNLPDPIMKKVSEHFSNPGTIRDDKWKARLEERFGFLWKIMKPILDSKGPLRIQPVQNVRQRNGVGGGGSEVGLVPETSNRAKTVSGFPDPNGVAAKEQSIAGGLPSYEPVGKDNFDEAWVLASWETPSSANEHRGRVLLNREHAVIKKHILEAQRSFVGSDDDIAEEVVAVYGELSVAHVAHSERMKGTLMTAREVEDDLRSDAAMTMALLGMWQIDTILLPRLAGKMTKRKLAS